MSQHLTPARLILDGISPWKLKPRGLSMSLSPQPADDTAAGSPPGGELAQGNRRGASPWGDGGYAVAAVRVLLGVYYLLSYFIAAAYASNGRSVVRGWLLAAYAVFGVATYAWSLSAAGRGRPASSAEDWLPAVDVAAFTALIALNDFRDSGYLPGVLLFVLILSYRRGLAVGLGGAAGAAVVLLSLYVVTGLRHADGAEEPVLLPAFGLVALGGAAAYWGNLARRHVRRLSFLNRITNISNPRFGVDRTLGLLLEQLRAFYNADTCLLVTTESDAESYAWRRARRGKPDGAMTPEPLAPEVAERLLALPCWQAVAYQGGPPAAGRRSKVCAVDARNHRRVEPDVENADALAELLEAPSYMSVAVSLGTSVQGRLFITGCGRASFGEADIELTGQLLGSLMPIIENIKLVDRLASDAAEQERKRIARDLHDSTVQPFIGIKMGLTAISRKMSAGHADVSGDVSKLLTLTDAELDDLRRYIRGLKEGESERSVFLSAVRRFISKFEDATGIRVELEVDYGLTITDRLAAEVFQLIAEGLSNIRRHTASSSAHVSMSCRGDFFTLVIENRRAGGEHTVCFRPVSINERTNALGGDLEVVDRADGVTQLRITIPL